MPDKPNMPQDLILLLVLSTLWGASYTFIKVGVESIPPVPRARSSPARSSPPSFAGAA